MHQKASSTLQLLINDMHRQENDQNHTTRNSNLGLTVIIPTSKYSDDMSPAKLKSAIAII